jgi:hypothetical protein
MNLTIKTFRCLGDISILLICISSIIGVYGVVFGHKDTLINIVIILSPTAIICAFIFYWLEQATEDLESYLLNRV